MKDFITIFFILSTTLLQAQTYDTPAGQEGSSAIPADSSAFIDWASGCEVIRGYGIISHPDSVVVDFGEAADATGEAGDNMVVSLGDSGVAVLTFDTPISDGPGPDLAVFENAFTGSFLELAFVEVSSDGVNFFRFPSISLTPVDSQVSTFGLLDATMIYNLAGKYTRGYGTPFDLVELRDKPGLDIDAVTHVKVIDVIGSIVDSLASRDSKGNKINDPWPTPFNTCGFDLDAVGVINNQLAAGNHAAGLDNDFVIFPNPATDLLRISNPGDQDPVIRITDITGKPVLEKKLSSETMILEISHWPSGQYIIQIIDDTQLIVTKLLIKQ